MQITRRRNDEYITVKVTRSEVLSIVRAKLEAMKLITGLPKLEVEIELDDYYLTLGNHTEEKKDKEEL